MILNGSALQPAVAKPSSSESNTFLTCLVGKGLVEEKYTVERFRSRVDGDIDEIGNGGIRVLIDAETLKGLRPARNEIIIAKGVKIASSGVQYWGDLATGLFFARNRSHG